MMNNGLSAAKVRGLAFCYYRVRELSNQPLPDEVKEHFCDFLASTHEALYEVTENVQASRWARAIVGSVLAAAMGAAVYLRAQHCTTHATLRFYGLTGSHGMTSQTAWKLVQPYVWEPVLTAGAVADITRQSGLVLHLPKDPSAVDVLVELTRPRGAGFPGQVGHWLVEFFRENHDEQNRYAEIYRNNLVAIQDLNERGELMARSNGLRGPMEREDWEQVIKGRLPRPWVEVRAGYAAARAFVEDYWKQWNPRRAEKAEKEVEHVA